MDATLEQAGDAGRKNRESRNSAEFGHWTVVPTNDDYLAFFDLIDITREVGLSLLNVHSYHDAGSSLTQFLTRILV